MTFLVIWLVYSVISLIWAISKADAIKNITFLFMGFLVIYFFIYYIKSEADLHKLFKLWIMSFGILIAVGLWEHITGNHLSVSRLFFETRQRYKYAPTGVFYNQNDFATLLALSTPFSIALYRYSNKVFDRICGIIISLLGFYMIIETGSRANIIAALIEIIFIFLFLMSINKKTKLVFITSILIIMSSLFFGSNIDQFYNKVEKEVKSIERETTLMEGSMAVRINLVKNGLHFLYSTATLGVGAGNADYYMANYPKYNTSGISNPHNWWLEVLVNYGLIVFFGYLSFYIGIIKRLWRNRKSANLKIDKMICEALLVAIIGFFFASMSSSSIMTFAPQWLLFGFALSFIAYFQNKKEVKAL